MKRCRLLLALAVGSLAVLAAVGCSSVQRGSDTNPLASAANVALAASSGDATKAAGGVAGATQKPNFLSTRGNKIVDSQGNVVTITGVNWFGMETGTFAPHGLWSRNWKDMLDQIASLGFNTIRLPYSSDLFDPNSKTGDGVDFKLNPDLKGLTGLQVMDKIIEGAGERGLKVILDRHRPNTGAQSKLWYDDKHPEDQWISDWVTLARRYKGNDTVIGADLENEPAGPATWGSGDPKTDWRLAAEKAGNAILTVNPDWLIIVEGIEKTDNDTKWYWMGGNLIDAAKNPIRLSVPNKLVYSAHDYGPEVYMQGWFKDPSFPANLPGVWDSYWGYLGKNTPILVGEFGGRSVGSDLAGTWQRTLVQYLKDHGFSYAYWAINPNSGDTGGILGDDWQTVNKDKMDLLSSYMAPKMRVSNPDQIDTSQVPAREAPKVEPPPVPEGKAAPEPGPDDARLQVLYQAGKTDAETNNPGVRLKLVNAGTVPIKQGDLEIRYWFNPSDAGDRGQLVDIDWASIGKDSVDGKVVKAGPQLDYLSLTFKDRDRSLEPGASIEVVARIHKDDWSNYNQKSAYSFSDSTTLQEWKRVTAYVGTALNWGTEPQLP